MSIPGSGNTWLRYLLESLTGVYTGDVYSVSSGLPGGQKVTLRYRLLQDKTFGDAGFKGSWAWIKPGLQSTFVFKTHKEM